MKLHHTGFVVRNRKASVAFYRDVVGLSLLREFERRGPDIDQVIGYQQAHLRWQPALGPIRSRQGREQPSNEGLFLQQTSVTLWQAKKVGNYRDRQRIRAGLHRIETRCP